MRSDIASVAASGSPRALATCEPGGDVGVCDRVAREGEGVPGGVTRRRGVEGPEGNVVSCAADGAGTSPFAVLNDAADDADESRVGARIGPPSHCAQNLI